MLSWRDVLDLQQITCRKKSIFWYTIILPYIFKSTFVTADQRFVVFKLYYYYYYFEFSFQNRAKVSWSSCLASALRRPAAASAPCGAPGAPPRTSSTWRGPSWSCRSAAATGCSRAQTRRLAEAPSPLRLSWSVEAPKWDAPSPRSPSRSRTLPTRSNLVWTSAIF